MMAHRSGKSSNFYPPVAPCLALLVGFLVLALLALTLLSPGDRSPPGVVTVFISAPDQNVASNLAEMLVSGGLAACCNIVPGVESVYRWHGRLQRDREHLLMVKTLATHVDKIVRLVSAPGGVHPYETPEVIALPVTDGSSRYLDWVRSAVGGAVREGAAMGQNGSDAPMLQDS
eukprot:jgi/Mesvir1/9420/Mv01522-RA.1